MERVGVDSWIDEELAEMLEPPRSPRRRPMVGISLLVILGTTLGILAPISAMWFWGLGSILILPLFLWIRRPWSVVPLFVAGVLLVAAHARLAVEGRFDAALRRVMKRPMEYVQFTAVVQDDAVPRPSRPGSPEDTVFPARVESLNRAGRWVRVEDDIRVVLRGYPADERQPLYGERWRFHGMVRTGIPRRKGLFTLPENEAVIDSDRAQFLAAGHGNPIKSWCMERRRACRKILSRGLDDFPEERGILQALLLGYREDLPSALRQDFAAIGTVHIFAISGAHVGMMTLIFTAFLRALGIPLTRWFVYMAPVLVIYTIMTGAATSAIRACIMALLFLAAPFFKRPSDSISALAIAASLILLVSPRQMGDLGFLLSFTAVAGLLAIQPVFDATLVQWFRRDEWQLATEELAPGRWLRENSLGLSRFASVSVSAWIGTSPLTAFFFNLFSPVALAMNLLVIPSAFLILLTGVMSLLVSPLGELGSEIFNHAARVLASFLAGSIGWAARIPGGHWFVPTPPPILLLIWYAILVVATVVARRIRGALLTGVSVLAILAVGWGIWHAQRCRVAVFGVGAGNAVYVQARTKHFLVDTGPLYRWDDTSRALRREGVNWLAALVVTHADAQHMGAAVEVLQQIPVNELWVPSLVWPSPLWSAMLAEATARDIPIRHLQAGERGQWPGNMAWEVLWPPAEMKMSCGDDASLVMRVARYGAAMMLASDLGEEQERRMMASGDSLAASLLLVGRHGDRSATTLDWLDAVRPRDAIISAGPHSEGRHPDSEVLERLAAKGISVWRTDQQGTVTVEFANAPARWPATGYRMTTRR